MTKKNTMIVKKANNLIRSAFLAKIPDGREVAGETTLLHNSYANLTEKEWDLINAFLFIIQTAYRHDSKKSLLDFLPEEDKGRVFIINIAQLKKLAGFKNRSTIRIESLIDGLTNRPIKLKQKLYFQDIDGKLKEINTKENTTLLEFSRFIEEKTSDEYKAKQAAELSDDKEKKPEYKTVEIHFSRLFMSMAHEQVYMPSGYTDLDTLHVTSIRGKVGKALYENIHSWGHLAEPGVKKTLILSHEDLITICGEQPHFAHYKKKLLDAIPKIKQYKIEIPEHGYIENKSIEIAFTRETDKITI